MAGTPWEFLGAVKGYLKASLPALGQAGFLGRVTDDVLGPWYLSASLKWYSLLHGEVNCDEYSNFGAAITAIGSTPRVLVLSSNQSGSGALSVPATLKLRFTATAKLTWSSGTLTILGQVFAPLHQVFDGAGTFSFAGNKSVTRMHPEWWGGTPDGVTDNQSAIQKAHNAAMTCGADLFFSLGTWLTGVITWAGCSLIGAGRNATIIQGLSSQDVFQTGGTGGGSLSAIRGRQLCDLTIKVNNSVNVSGSLSRDGVGNAGIAMLLPDGASTAGYWYPIDWDIRNLEFQSTSGAATNASAGWYAQVAPYNCEMPEIRYFNLEYGYREHYPTANVTSLPVAPDMNRISHWAFTACKYSVRFVNGAQTAIETLQIYSPTANGIGFEIASVASGANRIESSGWTVNGLFVENAGAAGVVGYSLRGSNHTFIKVVRQDNTSAANDTIDCDRSTFIGFERRGTATGKINITGDGNTFLSSVVPTAATWDDDGINNTIETRLYNASSIITASLTTQDSQGKARMRGWDFFAWLLGYGDIFRSGLDLVYSPNGMESLTANVATWTTTVQETTLEFGRYGSSTSNGSYLLRRYNQVFLNVGDPLPRGRVKVRIKGRTPGGAATQSTSIRRSADASVVGSATLSWTTSWTIQEFDVDLSAEAVGDGMYVQGNALSAGTTFDMAWIAFVPYAKDLLVRRLQAGGGTTLVAGDFALSAGFGSTASIGTITGTDTRFRATITSAGTGQAANPTVTLTFKDGAFPVAPFAVVSRGGGSQPTIPFQVTTKTTTTLILTFLGTPVAAETYILEVMVLG